MRSGSLLLRTFFHAPISALLVTRIIIGGFHEILYSQMSWKRPLQSLLLQPFQWLSKPQIHYINFLSTKYTESGFCFPTQTWLIEEYCLPYKELYSQKVSDQKQIQHFFLQPSGRRDGESWIERIFLFCFLGDLWYWMKVSEKSEITYLATSKNIAFQDQ